MPLGFINPPYIANGATVELVLSQPLPAGSNQIGLVGLVDAPLPAGGNVIGSVGITPGQSVAITGAVALAANTAVTIAGQTSASVLGQDRSNAQHTLRTDGAGALAPTRAIVHEYVISVPAGASTTLLNANADRFLWKVQTTTSDEVLISETGALIANANVAGTLLSGRGSIYAPPLSQPGAVTCYCVTSVTVRVTEYVDVAGS